MSSGSPAPESPADPQPSDKRRGGGSPEPERGLFALPFVAQVARGLVQPVHAAALLARDRELLVQALIPAGLLLLFCLWLGLLRALFSQEPSFFWTLVKTSVRTFAVLAPVPSIVLANHYARLSAQAHERLRGPCRARQMPLLSSAGRALRQTVVVLTAMAPLSLAARLVPFFGTPIAEALLLGWALLWIVLEALDDASVEHASAAAPLASASEDGDPLPWVPWFLWPVQRAADWLPAPLGGPLRWFVRAASWLCAPWRHEVWLVERHPPLMLGFAIATATLLCTPVLNLMFRPITIVAAIRLLGQLGPVGSADAAAQAIGPPSSQGPC